MVILTVTGLGVFGASGVCGDVAPGVMTVTVMSAAAAHWRSIPRMWIQLGTVASLLAVLVPLGLDPISEET